MQEKWNSLSQNTALGVRNVILNLWTREKKYSDLQFGRTGGLRSFGTTEKLEQVFFEEFELLRSLCVDLETPIWIKTKVLEPSHGWQFVINPKPVPLASLRYRISHPQVLAFVLLPVC